MMCIRKLIKYRERTYIVGLGDGFQVGFQGRRVAGDVNNIVKALGYRRGVRVHTSAWRVYEDCAEVVIVQVYVAESIEGTHFVQRLHKLFARHAANRDVLHLVQFNVKQRGIHRGFG